MAGPGPLDRAKNALNVPGLLPPKGQSVAASPGRLLQKRFPPGIDEFAPFHNHVRKRLASMAKCHQRRVRGLQPVNYFSKTVWDDFKHPGAGGHKHDT